MLANLFTTRDSPLHGLGVYATATIPRGTIIYVPCAACQVLQVAAAGEPASGDGVSRDAAEDLLYRGFMLADGRLLVSCGITRYINHSCDANVLDYGLDFCIAARDISAGEEITQDYRTFASDPPEAFNLACTCGAATCCGLVRPSPRIPDALLQAWNAKLVPALASALTVPQPLAAQLTTLSAIYPRLLAGEPAADLLATGASIRKPHGLRPMPAKQSQSAIVTL